MGRVAGPYGVKGWLKILPLTAGAETLLSYPQWWLRRRGNETDWLACALQAGRTHGNTLLVQLAGLADREAAAIYAGGDVGVARSALPAAREGEVYWADLVGLAVVNREGESLGRVVAVQDYGAHPVLQVKDGDDAARLIPFVAAYVDSVDVPAGRIEVDWRKDY